MSNWIPALSPVLQFNYKKRAPLIGRQPNLDSMGTSADVWRCMSNDQFKCADFSSFFLDCSSTSTVGWKSKCIQRETKKLAIQSFFVLPRMYVTWKHNHGNEVTIPIAMHHWSFTTLEITRICRTTTLIQSFNTVLWVYSLKHELIYDKDVTVRSNALYKRWLWRVFQKEPTVQ